MTATIEPFGGTPLISPDEIPTWPCVSEAEIEAVVHLLRSNTLSIYDRSGIYREFEDKFARYHAVEFALTHNSGTSALHAAFFAAGIGPGDEVLAPTYTFLATVTPILQLGATPVLCEMDPETLTIDPADIATKVTPRSRAIVVTHMWGHPCEMDQIRAIADAHELILIEDCSHAHGATYRGRKVGALADLGCFSLEGHKAVHAGEGGMLLTNCREFYERALMLGHFGKRIKQEITLQPYRRYVETGLGHKYRMHPVGAAIANARLARLDSDNAQRRENMEWFSARIAKIPGIIPPVTRSHCTRGGWYGYKLSYDGRALGDLPMAEYIRVLQAQGVPIKRPGSTPLHLLPLFQDAPEKLQALGANWRSLQDTRPRPYQRGDFPVAEERYAQLLSMPTFAVPAQALLEKCAKVMEWVAKHVQRHRHSGEG